MLSTTVKELTKKVVESKDNDTWEFNRPSENTHGEVPEEQCWEIQQGKSQIVDVQGNLK